MCEIEMSREKAFRIDFILHLTFCFSFIMIAMDKERQGTSEVKNILKNLKEGKKITECLKVILSFISD